MTHTSQHQLAELILALGTGRMTPETALRLAASAGTVEHFTMGANAHGKCAELIAMSARNSLNDPASPWVVVNTPSVPTNYVRAWLNPDTSSARDLLYEVRISDTRHIFVPGAQVKVGDPGYIARSLLSHAHDPRYAKICDVDARLVHPDGTPRVGPSTFTRGQAEALKKAGIKFVGIEHLEQDAKRVHAGLKGIHEHERIVYEQELTIRANYAPRQVAWRAGYAGGIAFAIIAGTASYQQYSYYRKGVKEGRIKDDPVTRKEYAKRATKAVAKQAAFGGAIAVAATVIESVVFHAAKIVTSAKTALLVAALPVCIAAVAVDIYCEYALVKRGQSTIGWAIFHGTLKVAADVLPLALAEFGPAERAREDGLTKIRYGALVMQHRFGSSLNLNTHLHAVFPDGVFSRLASGIVEFHELRQPEPDDLEEIAFNVQQRFMRWLRRHGLLKNEAEDDCSNESPELSALEACAQGSLGLGNLVKKRNKPGNRNGDADDGGFEQRAVNGSVGVSHGYSLYAGNQRLLFPTRVLHGTRKGELVWAPLCLGRVCSILHNPWYAGAYVYGRSRWRKHADGKTRQERLPRNQWYVNIQDAHPGYISWQEYEHIQQRLETASRAIGFQRPQTPPREGTALLQGRAVCGLCGSRMHTQYHTTHNGQLVPSYVCHGRGREFADPSCQSMLGTQIDAAVEKLLLEAVTPMALELALAVEQELQSRCDDADRLRHRQVERAQYEADLARSRYMHVDPANRLVADSLEANWNAKLRALAEAQENYQRQCVVDRRAITGEDRQRILALTQDFPAAWRDPKTPQRERKRMLALLIEDVALIKQRHITVAIRFRGGPTTTLTLPRPLTAQQIRATSVEARQQIDELLGEYTDAQVAHILNERGLLTGAGDAFDATSVHWVRFSAKLSTLKERLLATGMVTGKELRTKLGVSRNTIANWRINGRLKARICNDSGEWLYWPPEPLHRSATSPSPKPPTDRSDNPTA